jgi:hypothetical protein
LWTTNLNKLCTTISSSWNSSNFIKINFLWLHLMRVNCRCTSSSCLSERIRIVLITVPSQCIFNWRAPFLLFFLFFLLLLHKISEQKCFEFFIKFIINSFCGLIYPDPLFLIFQINGPSHLAYAWVFFYFFDIKFIDGLIFLILVYELDLLERRLVTILAFLLIFGYIIIFIVGICCWILISLVIRFCCSLSLYTYLSMLFWSLSWSELFIC